MPETLSVIDGNSAWFRKEKDVTLKQLELLSGAAGCQQAR
jgi:hypothetical protein